MDLDWALWALQGSYYTRHGVVGSDEKYGVLDGDWAGPRNRTVLTRIRALQRRFRRPVLFHPATGRCVVVVSPEQQLLELGPCDETAAAWSYTE
ncbi:hypothetical protein EJB05_56197, partial [Eragrostis curvula]